MLILTILTLLISHTYYNMTLPNVNTVDKNKTQSNTFRLSHLQSDKTNVNLTIVVLIFGIDVFASAELVYFTLSKIIEAAKVSFK